MNRRKFLEGGSLGLCALAATNGRAWQVQESSENQERLVEAPSTANDSRGQNTGSQPRYISLNGDCKFALDFQDLGESEQWYSLGYKDGIWDHVSIPHDWFLDPRFLTFMGAAWYRRSFVTPFDVKERHVRLVFEAVLAHAKVWLNGHELGEHVGGYTPFEFDVGPLLNTDAPNMLVVRVDNRKPEIPASSQGGGIIRDVELIVNAPIYVMKQKIEADPDLNDGTAVVRVRAWVCNTLNRDVAALVGAQLWREDEELDGAAAPLEVTLKASAVTQVDLRYALDRSHVSLWSLDTPVLYRIRTFVDVGDAACDKFGIRKFERDGTKLLLNGQPIRLAGANRIASHADWGQNDPPEGAALDMKMMKEAGLVFARMCHTPLSRAVLDWGDRHGMLFIEESTGVGPALRGEAGARDKFHRTHREMIERDWNRPSVVAWSIGNEFESDTPAGVELVQDMYRFCRSLDPTRLVTLVTNRVTTQVAPKEEASYYVDFVCMNTYSDPVGNGAHIDTMHARYPDKPLIVSEYGIRVNFLEDEVEREDWFRQMLVEIRRRPFLSGASVWSFNDYRSRYVGTSPNGYRQWGLVDEFRHARGSYYLFREECSGFVVRQAQLLPGSVIVRLAARSDFPVYPMAAAELRIRMLDGQGRFLEVKSVPISAMEPGLEQELHVPAASGVSNFMGEIWRNGIRAMTFGVVRS